MPSIRRLMSRVAATLSTAARQAYGGGGRQTEKRHLQKHIGWVRKSQKPLDIMQRDLRTSIRWIYYVNGGPSEHCSKNVSPIDSLNDPGVIIFPGPKPINPLFSKTHPLRTFPPRGGVHPLTIQNRPKPLENVFQPGLRPLKKKV